MELPYRKFGQHKKENLPVISPPRNNENIVLTHVMQICMYIVF